jgi:ABC-type Na+ efflux pump permease subunit
MSNRERRDYILITFFLMVFLFIEYLREDDSGILALTVVISAAVGLGAYWLGRRFRKKRDSAAENGADT